MKPGYKQWWLAGFGLLYVVLLGLSAWMQSAHPLVLSETRVPGERISQFLNRFDAAMWLSGGSTVWLKDGQGVRTATLQLGHAGGGLAVSELKALLCSGKAYGIAAESYAVMSALALASQHPDACKELLLMDARGLPAYERMGHPLLDRSLRSLQGGLVWAVRHGVPFAWRFAPSWVETKLASVMVASGAIPPLLDSLVLEVPVSIGVSSESNASQSEVLHRLIPHSRWLGSEGGAPAQADLAQGSDGWVGRAQLDPAERESLRAAWAARQDRWEGRALWVAVILLALSTLMSEDLACVGAGLLVSHGALGFAGAVGGCIAGIFVGDMALYAMGRLLGEQVLMHRPFRWMLSKEALLSSEQWFLRNGVWVLLASRFLPGTRVPVFLTAGILKARWWSVAAVLLGAALVWVPLLVAASSWVGERMLNWYEHYGLWAGWMMLGSMLLMVCALHQVSHLCTRRGRRRAQVRWMRRIRRIACLLPGAGESVATMHANDQQHNGEAQLRQVVIYDGDCGMCSRLVRFGLRWLRHADTGFLPSQHEAAQRWLAGRAMELNPTTLLLVRTDEVLERSDAVFELCASLRPPFSGLRVLRVLPRSLRDLGYRMVARVRRSLPFRPVACDLPGPRAMLLLDNPGAKWPEWWQTHG